MQSIAVLIPDISYFITCVSNGFYSFKENHKEFSSVSLLDPIRTKRIFSDLSWYLNSCTNLDKINTNEEDTIALKTHS